MKGTGIRRLRRKTQIQNWWQPRMNTDGHGSERLTRIARILTKTEGGNDHIRGRTQERMGTDLGGNWGSLKYEKYGNPARFKYESSIWYEAGDPGYVIVHP